MTPQLQNQLSSILSMLQESIKQGASLASEQLPDIAQQVVTYHLYSSSIFIAISVVLTVIFGGSFLFVTHFKRSTSLPLYKELEEIRIVLFFLFLISLVITTIIVAYHLPIFLQCLLAPKLFLLEYAARLIQ